jgi:2-polyprenyl-3-methyl-5-hydroxy-6-metoxy-1,4-benzoquinol methylase
MINNSSFRDPSGRLFLCNTKVIRVVHEEARDEFEAFLYSKIATELISEGLIPPSYVINISDLETLLSASEFSQIASWSANGRLVLEHERIPFPSYPFEWSSLMLHAAAELTLHLALRLLTVGMGLKDATPYNILFRGPRPVHVDLLSFEQRDPKNPTWLPYAQFVRTFLLPLLVNRHFNLPVDLIMLSRRDGIEPENVYELCGVFQRLRPPFLSLVSIPNWLSKIDYARKRASINSSERLADPEMARFILSSLFHRLQKRLSKTARYKRCTSKWTNYIYNNTYSDDAIDTKEIFILDILADKKTSRNVLDIGCNTGHFSVLAAKCGARVVSIDNDPAVIDRLWHVAYKDNLDILPLVVNIARPTPAVGWRNRECTSFYERARASFDTVLMLAVLHHLLVTDQIPLEEIIDFAAELTTDILIVEFITKEDPMFRELARGRDYLYKGFTREHFEKVCERKFLIQSSICLPDSAFRWLYLLRKKGQCSNGQI